MSYDPDKHHRRSIRLKGYDYSRAGAYDVTICTHQRLALLGKVINAEAQLNEIGELVRDHWLKAESHSDGVELDMYIIMPNHLHGIIVLTDDGGVSLADIVADFKKFPARTINRIREQKNSPFWQRNYYEHIIRDEDDLHRIQTYISNNPAQWTDDQYYMA